MKTIGAQLLGVLGVLGSLLWLSLNTLLSPDFGYPGSTDYLGYQTINRLWAPAFALMLCGFVGLYQCHPLSQARSGRLGFRLATAGLVVMAVGNIAEFWFLTELPYGQLNMRAFAWIGLLLGMLSLLIGTSLLGLAGWRHQVMPAWGSAVLALGLPIFIWLFFSQRITEAWLVLGGLGLMVGLLALAPRRMARAPQPHAQGAA
ncbi:MAG: hypothetical protein ABI847_04040 [Anaerolineales bacterium]